MAWAGLSGTDGVQGDGAAGHSAAAGTSCRQRPCCPGVSCGSQRWRYRLLGSAVVPKGGTQCLESPAQTFPSLFLLHKANKQPSSQPLLWCQCPWPWVYLLSGTAMKRAFRLLLQLHPAASPCPGTGGSPPGTGSCREGGRRRRGEGAKGRCCGQPGCATAAGWATAKRARGCFGACSGFGTEPGAAPPGKQQVPVPRRRHSPTLTTSTATYG